VADLKTHLVRFVAHSFILLYNELHNESLHLDTSIYRTACCTTCCPTNPQQIATVEFDYIGNLRATKIVTRHVTRRILKTSPRRLQTQRIDSVVQRGETFTPGNPLLAASWPHSAVGHPPRPGIEWHFSIQLQDTTTLDIRDHKPRNRQASAECHVGMK